MEGYQSVPLRRALGAMRQAQSDFRRFLLRVKEYDWISGNPTPKPHWQWIEGAATEAFGHSSLVWYTFSIEEPVYRR